MCLDHTLHSYVGEVAALVRRMKDTEARVYPWSVTNCWTAELSSKEFGHPQHPFISQHTKALTRLSSIMQIAKMFLDSFTSKKPQLLGNAKVQSRVLFKKIIVAQPVKFDAFYRTRRFIIVFTIASYCSLSSARLIQSTHSNHISLRSCLMLPSRLRPGFLSSLFPSDFPIKTE
jgi:hypothetical protein